jgi:P27 family predicted phage terminase small subunit
LTALRAAGGGRKNQGVEVGSLDKVPTVHRQLINDVAREVWRATAKELVDRKILAPDDQLLLLQYCNAFARLQIIEEQLGEAFSLSTASGGAKLNPLVLAHDKFTSQFVRIGSLLGLNPMARARFIGGGKGGDDDEDDFSEF